MFVCPFPTDRWENLGCFFFFGFNFAFLSKFVEINFSKCIVTVPKVNCVGTEGMCVYPIHVFTRLFDVTYLDLENYMIYFLQHSDLKKKKRKEKIDLPTFFRPKGQTNLYFLGLRSFLTMLQITTVHEKFSLNFWVTTRLNSTVQSVSLKKHCANGNSSF